MKADPRWMMPSTPPVLTMNDWYLIPEYSILIVFAPTGSLLQSRFLGFIQENNL